jgi:peptidoglycan/LPS O-acetylase OafA/YrhL
MSNASESGPDDQAPYRRFRSNLESSRIPALDGLRAIAVLLVIGFHLEYSWIDGPLGVEIFFVLSGFLITWLLLKEQDRNGKISVSQFYWRRIFRILPAFYCYWLIGLAMAVLRNRPIDWGLTVSAALYYANYYLALIDPEASTYLSHTWSLAVEEQFYLLWPIVFVLASRDLRRLTVTLTCIIAAVWMYRPFLYLVAGAPRAYIYYSFDTRADHLLIGCLLAVTLRRNMLQRFWNRACLKPGYPLIPICIIILSSGLAYAFDKRSVYRYAIGYAIEPVAIAVLIAQLIALSTTRPWGVLEHVVPRYLGTISYSLYLYQQTTIFTARRLTASYPELIQVLFALAVTIAFASASHFFIERPFLEIGRTLARRWRPRAPEIAA